MKKLFIAAAAVMMIAAMPTASFAHGHCGNRGYYNRTYVAPTATSSATCYLNADGTYSHTSACGFYGTACTLEGCNLSYDHTHGSCNYSQGCANYVDNYGYHYGHHH